MATIIRRVLLVAILGAFLGLPAVASASTVTVGSPLAATFTSVKFTNVSTVVNSSFGEPTANLTSPVNGVIVRWRIFQATGGPFKLRVVTPAGGSSYTGAGTSSPESPTSTSVQTFSTNLPIKAGQTIGLDNTNGTDHIGATDTTGGTFISWTPPLADGSTQSATAPPANGEVAFNADVVAQPGITAITPASGPVAGGTRVVIRGHDFSGATAVSFAGKSSTSFTVNSDSQITAVAPPSSETGPVHVTVTTPGGTSPPATGGRFEYTPVQCVVPNLKGKTLAKARRMLKPAHCKLGNVKKPKHHKGQLVVKSQSSAKGAVLADGAKVSVKLAPKPHHEKHR